MSSYFEIVGIDDTPLILEIIRQNPGITTKKISDRTGIPVHKVRRLADSLVKRRMIKRTMVYDRTMVYAYTAVEMEAVSNVLPM